MTRSPLAVCACGCADVPPGILDGVRVLDFGRYIAGPFCAALLGDFGAEVIRVEKIGGGEDRGVIPVGAEGDGSLYLQVNRNKLGITLDPVAPAGREVERRLVRRPPRNRFQPRR